MKICQEIMMCIFKGRSGGTLSNQLGTNLFGKRNLSPLHCLNTKYLPKVIGNISPRVRPRFFDQVGHETMYASSGNKDFFTKSCHRQTYQNYEHPP